ncbi:D-glycero-beta-D-manno-heptose-7-phosphate kinase [Candidatus Symbiobacter mobilis]|nr:D-glycero-beta-D-manno-heptose-7-phosphate kinase [Candidatus Symbiobacter mobilis]
MNLTKDRLSQARVLVVGDVMLDRYWYGDVDRISPEAPVPVVRIQREEDRNGGAANVAANLAALGVRTTLLSVVGEDDAARSLEALLERAGIRPHLARDPSLKTTVKLRVIGRHQQLVRVDFENTPQREVLASQTAAFAELLPTHDAVLFSDYGKGGLGHIADMIAHATRWGLPVLVDPKGCDYSRYAGATLITPNRLELQQVIGAWGSEAQLQEWVQTLRTRLGVAAILLTRSEEGMTLFDETGPYSVATQAREVFDVTGAGDTVIATMAALVAAGQSLRDAVPLANRAGGLVVEKFGTATITYEELFA